MGSDDSPKTVKRGKGSVIYAVFGILLVSAVLFLSISLHADRQANLLADAQAREAAAKAGPLVRYITAGMAPPERAIELVGEANPYLQATLYAKISGYLREIHVDYGDKVTEGQVLAIVENPELDRQVDAAMEDAKNKEAEAKRGWTLFPQKAISIEDAQTRETAARMSRAEAASLLAQKEYEIIRSPFAGVVTERFADPGALLQNASTTQTAALPVVTVSLVDKLKVYAYCDQANANYIQVGNAAEIRDVTRSEEPVPATVSRTSVQLSAKTRTLLLQLDVDNRKGLLVPGSFVRITLKIKTPPRVQIPVEALVYRTGDPYAAVITKENKINFRQVVIAVSDGKTARLMSGVREGERVALNLGAGVGEGDVVRPIEAKAK